MTREEAAKIVDPDTTMESLEGLSHDEATETFHEACRIAAEALRQHSGEPLTLEQLRGMDGRPVWCKSLINGKSEWAILRIVEMSKTWFVALAGASQGFGDKDTYSKTWLAYPYQNAQIDREAWTAEWTVDEFGHKCSKCGEYLPDDSARKPQFCPECGRAMTPEAWGELEKRMGAMV